MFLGPCGWGVDLRGWLPRGCLVAWARGVATRKFRDIPLVDWQTVASGTLENLAPDESRSSFRQVSSLCWCSPLDS